MSWRKIRPYSSCSCFHTAPCHLTDIMNSGMRWHRISSIRLSGVKHDMCYCPNMHTVLYNLIPRRRHFAASVPGEIPISVANYYFLLLQNWVLQAHSNVYKFQNRFLHLLLTFLYLSVLRAHTNFVIWFAPSCILFTCCFQIYWFFFFTSTIYSVCNISLFHLVLCLKK
jgi:hypothetical protein